jgi:hypothetical protein
MEASPTLEENDIAWRDEFEPKLMNSWIASDKSTRIPISTFQLALELHGVEVDVEEVECMLANMVYRVSPSSFPTHTSPSFPIYTSPSFISYSYREEGLEANRQGYMKGYISHEKSMVVLAKTNPFPNLNSIAR